MIFSLKICLAVFMLIDLLMAWRYANDRDICKVIIFYLNYFNKERIRINATYFSYRQRCARCI